MMIKKYYPVLVLSFIMLLNACYSGKKATMVTGETGPWKLIWSDEFDRKGLPDTTKWGYDLGDGCPNVCGWGNNELQWYSAGRSENSRVENGKLIIEAHKEKTGTKNFSSARLVSKNKGDWKYGKIDVRAKLPSGLGVWPAIWMLPTDWKYGGWPTSGEIDIMEFVGYMPDSVFGTVHTQKFNHGIGTQVSKGLFDESLSSDFHNYGIEWDADKIDFLYDGKKYLTFTNRHQGVEAWPFDQRFYLILNLAVGGNWGGKMGVSDSIWPQKMEVDYVRVYQL